MHACHASIAPDAHRVLHPLDPHHHDEPASDREQAERLRGEAALLHERGELHRATVTLTQADRLCPQSVEASAPLLLATLAELRQDPEVRALAARIRSLPRADARSHQAVEAALALIASPPPAGSGLLEAALREERAGHAAQARGLYDRACVAFEREQGAPPVLELEREPLPYRWLAGRGRYLAIASEQLAAFDLDASAPAWRLEIPGAQPLRFGTSPDGKVVAVLVSDGTVRLLALATGEPLAGLASLRSRMPADRKDFAFSPDGRWVSWVESDPERGGSDALRLVDLSARREAAPIVPGAAQPEAPLGCSAGRSTVMRLGWAREGAIAVVQWTCAGLQLWDVQAGRELGSFPLRSSSLPELSAQSWDTGWKGKWVAWRPPGPKPWVERYDLEARARRQPLRYPGAGDVVSVSEDGATIAVAGQQSPCAWEAQTGRRLPTGRAGSSMAVWLSKDGGALATGATGFFGAWSDAFVRPSDGAPIELAPRRPSVMLGPPDMAISADGSVMAASLGPDGIHLWSMPTGQGIRPGPPWSSVPPPTGPSAPGSMPAEPDCVLPRLALSADGGLLAVHCSGWLGGPGRVLLWDVRRGSQVGTRPVRSDTFLDGFGFGSDTQLLGTGRKDLHSSAGVLQLWPTDPSQPGVELTNLSVEPRYSRRPLARHCQRSLPRPRQPR